MRFAVIGAGAVGGLVGARLADAGHEVTLVARGAHLAAIQAQGLTVEAPGGTATLRLPAVARVAELVLTDDTVILLAVKTHDAASVLHDLALVAPPAVPIVCLTNGLETERLAARWFARVYAGCVWSPASHLEPGIVQAWGVPMPGHFDLGRFPSGVDAFVDALAASFTATTLCARAEADILRWKRGKLLGNLSNAIEALCGEYGGNHPLVTALRAEGERCFAAAGLPFVSEAEMTVRYGSLRAGTIAGRSRRGGSTWQSLARGAQALECEYLNGEISLLGRLHGVPTPVNDAVLSEVSRAAAAGTAAGSLVLDELTSRLAASTVARRS